MSHVSGKVGPGLLLQQRKFYNKADADNRQFIMEYFKVPVAMKCVIVVISSMSK